MEKPVAYGVAQKALNDNVGQRVEIKPLGAQGGHIGHGCTVDPIGCENPFGTQCPIHGGNTKMRIILGILRHLGKGRRLHAQIKLKIHGVFEHSHRCNGPQTPSFLAQTLGHARRKGKTIYVIGKAPLHRRTQDFNSNIAPVQRHTFMHLGNGCRGN